VHYFFSARISQGLRSQKHCLLPRENSQKQPQQAKAVLAQKTSNLTEKVRRKAGYFPVNTGKVHPLQIPVISLILYCKRLTLYCKCLTLAHTTISYFFCGGFSLGTSRSQISLLEFDKCFHRINSTFPIYGLQPRKLRQEIS
jgi:hypothetical protein